MRQLFGQSTTSSTAVSMKQMENYNVSLKDANLKILKKTTDHATKSHKCNQCGYASSHAGNFSKHFKMHSGEKSNKCNQYDFASSQAGHLRTHLKTHSGEKPNKCNQCDYACSEAGKLVRHLKT